MVSVVKVAKFVDDDVVDDCQRGHETFPVEIQIFKGEIQDIPVFVPAIRNTDVDMEKIKKAAELLSVSKNIGMFIGWGCRDATENCIKIREDVYERAIKGYGRDRFTLAHELGHFLMHQPRYQEY